MLIYKAKEHAHGRLHLIAAAPYPAFDDQITKCELHPKVALRAVMRKLMVGSYLAIQMIHNGVSSGSGPAFPTHHDRHAPLWTTENRYMIHSSS
ncbi:hypothetical protein [Halomonas stenophila]|uniref:Uncharacterized protein n=1 Tax=Halomonas stenophila TaxID=795312 RepID=A0A7W5ETW2_9GAMM|nr:hypothetical protein [Halomonas stenophila]MBB3231374.1 hypothetical protein [Halomonas stenophila]